MVQTIIINKNSKSTNDKSNNLIKIKQNNSEKAFCVAKLFFRLVGTYRFFEEYYSKQ